MHVCHEELDTQLHLFMSEEDINNYNNKKVLFTDGLCHIMWFSIGHCIRKMAKYRNIKNIKKILKMDELRNVTLNSLVEPLFNQEEKSAVFCSSHHLKGLSLVSFYCYRIVQFEND